MLEEKYKQIVRGVKDDRQRLLDKYEKSGYIICMPIKYIKKREVKEVTIFSDSDIEEEDEDLFIEPVPEEVKDSLEIDDPDLKKDMERMQNVLKQNEKEKEEKSEKKGFFSKFKKEKK